MSDESFFIHSISDGALIGLVRRLRLVLVRILLFRLLEGLDPAVQFIFCSKGHEDWFSVHGSMAEDS